MTDQTTAELIAEARDIWEVDDLYPDEMIPRLVKALEAAEQRAEFHADQEALLRDDIGNLEAERDSAMASYKDYMALRRKAAELSAVVEKARAVIECESGWFRYRAGRVLDILATAPDDALREVKAEAWQEGAYRVYNSTLDEAEWWWSDWASENPYKAREEKP